MIISDHALSIRKQCNILDINRSSLYYCPEEDFNDYVIMNLISEIHQKFPYYGYRKIHWHLNHYENQKINRKKVQRLMKVIGIQCIFPGPKTSIPNKEDSVFPYLLKDLQIVRPNQVWAVDITYIKLPVGMVYLFALIDWYSRFIVAHQLVNTMEAQHAINTIEIALKLAKPEICNADQGSQFTGSLWIEKLQANSIKISHDGVGRCIDNIRIERFWRTIKYEDIFIRAYNNMSEARSGINVFIKYYNEHRPHQALSYKTPAQVYMGKI
jgi:putative transposase